ncbi:hypothetical protein, partial [Streptomyces sp. A012304]|uniref:hypothetical protein n=1 Tax=Streptomyces sp. A012304 TaxID=375446 RepID=UPI00222FDC02
MSSPCTQSRFLRAGRVGGAGFSEVMGGACPGPRGAVRADSTDFTGGVLFPAGRARLPRARPG